MNNVFVSYFVYTARRATRRKLVEFLESEGFKCEVDSVTDRRTVLGSRLPVAIYATDKRYAMLHNVTCAAGAASRHLLISEEEFYVLYKGGNCTREEYQGAVRKALQRYRYTVGQIDEFFARPDVERLLRCNYADYIIGLEGCSPMATAESIELKIE